MQLNTKLFLSYLIVIALTLLTISTAAALLAPENFSRQIQHEPLMMGGGQGQRRGQHMQDEVTIDEEALRAQFQEAVNDALLVAGLVAVVAAGIASWLVSWRIVRPIGAMVTASQSIADGHYEQRLDVNGQDELATLADSFNQMAAKLSEIEAMRRQLLADVSHELKTPLASINGLMEGLQDGVMPATPETFQLVREEAERLQRLVEDLQALSRAEAATVMLEMRPHAPSDLIVPVVTKMRSQFEENGVELTAQILDGMAQVCADKDRTQQVLTNLLGNALQYTQQGGQVVVWTENKRGEVWFGVRDTGIGLMHEDLKRIFQRFYRVDKSRARALGGSGIGLTIARHLVEAQGGRIWAESAGLGQGSTFWFTLRMV